MSRERKGGSREFKKPVTHSVIMTFLLTNTTLDSSHMFSSTVDTYMARRHTNATTRFHAVNGEVAFTTYRAKKSRLKERKKLISQRGKKLNRNLCIFTYASAIGSVMSLLAAYTAFGGSITTSTSIVRPIAGIYRPKLWV